jgi:nucleoside-diphosphate-sugar epimerase
VLRFAFFYGPDSDFSQQMIAMVRKGWAASFGSPDGYISSVTHDDAAAAVVAALTIPSGIYNVVDDQPMTKRDFNNALADVLGVKHPRFLPSWVRYFAGSLGETLARSQRISNRKLRESSSWRPAYPSASEGWKAIIGS